eukprot:scaffold350210_cov34-Prasinocladus_malaysianus.AAC.1
MKASNTRWRCHGVKSFIGESVTTWSPNWHSKRALIPTMFYFVLFLFLDLSVAIFNRFVLPKSSLGRPFKI